MNLHTITLRAALVAAAFAFFGAPTTSQAAEPEPGKDHPLIGRYEGSVMTDYRAPKYDEAVLVKGRMEGDEQDYFLKLEGNTSFYRYELPPNRSALEVFRNYEAGLKAKGLEIVFSCRDYDGSCGGDIAGKLDGDPMRWPGVFRSCLNNKELYLLAKNSTTYIGIIFCDSDPTNVHVAMVESKEMDTGKMMFVDSSAMQKAINDTGRINLYGIHFDFDKDEIKPDSYNTIFEMIQLMQSNPQLKLEVIGHTDSQGLEAHNLDLSSRRAGAVIRSLVQAGITVDRLKSRGAGSSQPVATNDNEDGRAKNRRVELVKQ